MKAGIIWSHQGQKATVNNAAIVVDILRASTLITTILYHGAEFVLPVLETETAFCEAKKHGALLIGERNCNIIKGFDFSNSPSAIKREQVEGKKAVFSSTNFPTAFFAAEKAHTVFIGSMLNVGFVTEYVYSFAVEKGLNINYVIAGNRDYPADEDIAFAAVSGAKLLKKGIDVSGEIREIIDMEKKTGYVNLIKNSEHAQKLYPLNLASDVEFAGRKDIFNIIPVVKEGKVVKLVQPIPD